MTPPHIVKPADTIDVHTYLGPATPISTGPDNSRLFQTSFDLKICPNVANTQGCTQSTFQSDAQGHAVIIVSTLGNYTFLQHGNGPRDPRLTPVTINVRTGQGIINQDLYFDSGLR
jgi:hypothetical protein